MYIFDGPSTQPRIPRRQQPSYEFHNVTVGALSTEPINDYFHLLAPPDSRLSRNGTGDDNLTAPIMLRKLHYPFVLCEVTISGELEMDWDQGGIAVFCGGLPALSNRGRTRPQSREYVMVDRQLDPKKCRWARVGLELIAGELGVSSVVANPGCSNDWCFTPLLNTANTAFATEDWLPSLRVKLERVADDLWVWYKIPVSSSDSIASRTPEMLSRQWRKCREISGFFDDAARKGGVWVGCFASRPSEIDNPTADDALFVEFEDLEIL